MLNIACSINTCICVFIFRADSLTQDNQLRYSSLKFTTFLSPNFPQLPIVLNAVLKTRVFFKTIFLSKYNNFTLIIYFTSTLKISKFKKLYKILECIAELEGMLS